MGGGSGGGYAAHSLVSNIDRLSLKYPLGPDGKFGKPGKTTAQVIESKNPLATAREFFQHLSVGSEDIQNLENGTKMRASFGGKAFVMFREFSKSGGPAISLRIKGEQNVDYKIHFLPKK